MFAGSMKKKSKSPLSCLKTVDACPKCGTRFKNKMFDILWKDVLECRACGNVWIAQDMAVVRMYI